MAGKWWVGTCKDCKQPLAVRPSLSEGNQMEIPNPCRKTTVQWPKCQNVNEYSDAELEQVDATVHLIDEQ
jgi:hypothetical protein